MEHVLRLLRRHGVTDTVVTLQFLASLVRNYFGDGDELGMSLQDWRGGSMFQPVASLKS